MINNLLTKIGNLYQVLNDRKYLNISYSQEGEDLILSRFFNGQQKGFFVDVGAHHPKRYSNSYIFYKKGWTGINVDAMPGSMKAFNELRPNDINIEAAISNSEEKLTYFIFNEPALNGFSERISEERDTSDSFKIIDKIEIHTTSLENILSKHVPANQKTIDFLSIDVEGLDFEVIKSNNWDKYRPTIILVELLDAALLEEDPVFKFLTLKNYSFYAKTHYTFFFIDNKIAGQNH